MRGRRGGPGASDVDLGTYVLLGLAVVALCTRRRLLVLWRADRIRRMRAERSGYCDPGLPRRVGGEKV
jgi:hypothetical protein